MNRTHQYVEQLTQVQIDALFANVDNAVDFLYDPSNDLVPSAPDMDRAEMKKYIYSAINTCVGRAQESILQFNAFGLLRAEAEEEEQKKHGKKQSKDA